MNFPCDIMTIILEKRNEMMKEDLIKNNKANALDELSDLYNNAQIECKKSWCNNTHYKYYEGRFKDCPLEVAIYHGWNLPPPPPPLEFEGWYNHFLEDRHLFDVDDDTAELHEGWIERQE